jgi:hypothetical protein
MLISKQPSKGPTIFAVAKKGKGGMEKDCH